MPTPPQSQQHLAGSRFPAQSRQRQPSFLTPRRQSVGRGLRRDGCMGALGRPARSLPPWCQTNHLAVGPPSVSSAVSVRCNAACEMEAVQKWPISRLLPRPRRQAEPRAVMPMSWPDEVARPYCRSWPICEASRPLESLGAPLSVTVSAVCGRWNEWNGNVGASRTGDRRNCSEMEWSGRKVMSPASGAAEACRYLARGTSASVGSVTPWGKC